jgi:ribulose-phosphate 3-epimerase
MTAKPTFQLAGSILSGDLLNLGAAIATCEQAGADLLQLDICDGHFVPTISFGEEVVRRTCQVARVPVEVHLMVSRPEDWPARLRGLGHFRVIFHIEASLRAMGLVQSIAAEGWKPGVALNPETPPGAVEPLLPYLDNVCVMGIAPGFAGQKMLDTTFRRVSAIRAMIEATDAAATITVDGGVKAENARALVEAGADILVVSSGIFQHRLPRESLQEIRQVIA